MIYSHKRTPARAIIVEFLSKSSSPVDVEQIIQFLRSKSLNTNKVTIYRTLDFLYDNGFVDKLEFGEGKFRYEVKKGEHHHLICEKCKSVEDISDCAVDILEEEIRNKKEFLVKRHSLEFFGICKNCQL